MPKAIPAQNWKRLTFLYTTGEYLLQAKNLNDLVVQSEERRLLWRALRERAGQAQTYGELELPELDVDPSILAAFLGIKNYLPVMKRKWPYFLALAEMTGMNYLSGVRRFWHRSTPTWISTMPFPLIRVRCGLLTTLV